MKFSGAFGLHCEFLFVNVCLFVTESHIPAQCFNNSTLTNSFNGVLAVSVLAHQFKNMKKIMNIH